MRPLIGIILPADGPLVRSRPFAPPVAWSKNGGPAGGSRSKDGVRGGAVRVRFSGLLGLVGGMLVSCHGGVTPGVPTGDAAVTASARASVPSSSPATAPGEGAPPHEMRADAGLAATTADSRDTDVAAALLDAPQTAPEIGNGTVLTTDLGEVFLSGNRISPIRSAPTVAGEMGVRECDAGANGCSDEAGRRWGQQLTLRGEVVFPTTCNAGLTPGCADRYGWEYPGFVGRIDDLVPRETIILVHVQNTDNLCAGGGPFFFMYVHENASIEYSTTMGMCWGKAEIERRGAVVRIRIYDQSARQTMSLKRRPLPDTIYTYNLVQRKLTTQN